MREFVEERDDLCLETASVKRSQMEVPRTSRVISYAPCPFNLVNITPVPEEGPIAIDRYFCSRAGALVSPRDVGPVFYPGSTVVAFLDDPFRSIFIDRKS